MAKHGITISVDLALHEIVRAKFGNGGINSEISHDMWFQTMLRFDKCRLRRACVASFQA